MIRSMRTSFFPMLILALLFPVAAYCQNIEGPSPLEQSPGSGQSSSEAAAITETVNKIFFDSSKNLWIGTNTEGIRYYDGKSLISLTGSDGLSGNTVTDIIEDPSGQMWFATTGGISIYDGKALKRVGKNEGLSNEWVLCLLLDSRGSIWASTLGGVFRYDGRKFEPFDLPEATSDNARGVTSRKLVGHITEDRAGHIWFATNGAGAIRFDGKTLKRWTEKDGLSCDFVNRILEDRSGNIWFTTDDKGVCRFDGNAFTQITDNKTVHGDKTWTSFEDSKGNIWFAPEGHGVYRYDGRTFKNFTKASGLPIPAVRCIAEDSKGRIWIGGGGLPREEYGGPLYRFDGKTFTEIKRDGPWS